MVEERSHSTGRAAVISGDSRAYPMKQKGIVHQNWPATDLLPCPALSVVVYRRPGPDDRTIERHARTTADAFVSAGSQGGLGYVTLVESDFDRVRAGILGGDLLSTAFAILSILDSDADEFLSHPSDFIFGWIELSHSQFACMILQVHPRLHLLGALN